jgi:outer membrane protein TolC
VQAGIAAAQAELERDDAELGNAELRTSLDVDQARREQEAARRQLELAESRRQLAADNLALARKSYDLGESDLATLLRVQSSAFEAQRAAERARISVLVARGRLNQALGVIP